jgi:threonine synthase
MSSACYVDPVDGQTFPLGLPRWRSDAGRPLMITALPGITRADIVHEDRSLWRYRAALPIEITDPVTLGEGCTPLLQRAWGQHRPFLKLDSLNPTGSFKDRGTTVMLSYLRQCGVEAVLEDSSGNGGASVAGYGAAGGLRVKIIAPASTSPTKIAQVRAYGAEVQLVDGPRSAAADEAIRQSASTCYASHNWQALFLHGTKTQAYEIWEDLGCVAPDNVIMPVGAGSSLIGCYLGFAELLAAGQVTRMPRLFAAQPLNCSPIDASFTAGRCVPVPREVRPTVAEGTAIEHPLRLRQIVEAIGRTGGATVALTEQEIIEALGALCRDGLFVEPTSASAAAALDRLVSRGVIEPTQCTVVILSGSGLKAAGTVADLVGAVPRVG